MVTVDWKGRCKIWASSITMITVVELGLGCVRCQDWERKVQCFCLSIMLLNFQSGANSNKPSKFLKF